METIAITAFIILAGGLALMAVERSLFFRKGLGAQLLLTLAGVLLIAHAGGLLGIPPHVMGKMVWGDLLIALALFAATRLISHKVTVSRMLSLFAGVAICVLHGYLFLAQFGRGFSPLMHHASFAFVAEGSVVVIGIITALASFHMRWLDVDPYHTF